LSEQSGNIHQGLYPVILFTGGFIAASNTFSAMHERASVHDWLMLPASNEEKFLARLAAATLGYYVAATLLYTAATFIGGSLSLLLGGYGASPFNPFHLRILALLPHFLIVQSIFFAGGAVFRKHQFFKTLVVLAVCGIAYGIFTVLAARLIFGDYADSWHSFGFSLEFDSPVFITTRQTGGLLATLLKTIYHWLLAPFCWLLAYFRLRETEVRHAV